MQDFPRVPRDRYRRETNIEKAVIGTGCLIGLGVIAFWGLVAYVVGHFVLKYW